MHVYGIHYLTVELVDSLGRARYFQKGFVATEAEEEVILGMPFLKYANLDINHSKGTFKWKTYNAQTALKTVQRVKVVDPETWATDVLREPMPISCMSDQSMAILLTPHLIYLLSHASLPNTLIMQMFSRRQTPIPSLNMEHTIMQSSSTMKTNNLRTALSTICWRTNKQHYKLTSILTSRLVLLDRQNPPPKPLFYSAKTPIEASGCV